MKPVQRLNKESRTILEAWHPDTDTAIRLMSVHLFRVESQLKTSESVTKALQSSQPSVTKPLQENSFGNPVPTTHDDAYWKKLESKVEDIIKKYAGG